MSPEPNKKSNCWSVSKDKNPSTTIYPPIKETLTTEIPVLKCTCATNLYCSLHNSYTSDNRKDAECHCARTSKYHTQDSNYDFHTTNRCWTEAPKTTDEKIL